ncbi:MAG: YciI family protein [Pseudomonadota bacterium]
MKSQSKLKFRAALAGAVFVASACASSQSIAQEAPMSPPPELAERASKFLNMELYVYETVVAGSPEQVMANMDGHLDYQVQLEKEGIMFAAGPLWEEGAPAFPPKAGLIIVRASSFEEAKAIADGDPMHSSGARTYTLKRWSMNEGTLDVTIKFSDQSVVVE